MNRPYTFTAEIERDDDSFEVTVSYICTPFVAATYWQPAEGGEVEVESILRGNEPAILDDAEEAAILAECEARAGSDMADRISEIADYRAEMHMEREIL